jgi:toxin HigB-1
MIGSIKHKGLAALYYEDQTKGLKQSHVKRLRQILALLATASTAEDMNVPGLKFHQLRADLAGFYTVAVSGNWRMIFRFEEGKAFEVDLIDYH